MHARIKQIINDLKLVYWFFKNIQDAHLISKISEQYTYKKWCLNIYAHVISKVDKNV